MDIFTRTVKNKYINVLFTPSNLSLTKLGHM